MSGLADIKTPRDCKQINTTHTFGGELGIDHINIIRGGKEPRNLQNHKGVKVLFPCVGPEP